MGVSSELSALLEGESHWFEAIAIYEVRAGKIAKVTLIRGKKVIDSSQ
jgi:hypothetical protein